jgi:hypothetical protein
VAKFTNDVVLEAALTKVATANRMTITDAAPATVAAATSGSLITPKVLTPGVGGVSFSAYANGDVSGRKITVLAQSGLAVSTSGNANHVNLDDGTNLLHSTTVPTQALTSGNTVNVAAYDVEFADVTP